MSKAIVSNAGRVRPGDRIVSDAGPVFVTRVVKAQGRKPPRGENLRIIALGSVTARKAQEIRVNSLDPIKIMGRPLTNA